MPAASSLYSKIAPPLCKEALSLDLLSSLSYEFLREYMANKPQIDNYQGEESEVGSFP